MTWQQNDDPDNEVMAFSTNLEFFQHRLQKVLVRPYWNAELLFTNHHVSYFPVHLLSVEIFNVLFFRAASDLIKSAISHDLVDIDTCMVVHSLLIKLDSWTWGLAVAKPRMRSLVGLGTTQISSVGFSSECPKAKQRPLIVFQKGHSNFSVISSTWKTVAINSSFDVYKRAGFVSSAENMMLFLTNHIWISAFLHGIVGRFDTAVSRKWYTKLSIGIATLSSWWDRSVPSHHLCKEPSFLHPKKVIQG